MSVSNERIRQAYKKGYRATEDGLIISHKGVVLKLCKGTNGYLVFGARGNEGVSRTISAHRFVAYCKYGEKALEANCVRHHNGIRDDISFDNILIGSLSDNFQDNPEHWKLSFAMAGAKTRRKLSEEQAREAKVLLKDGLSMQKTADKLGVSRTSIQQIKEGKSYKWITI